MLVCIYIDRVVKFHGCYDNSIRYHPSNLLDEDLNLYYLSKECKYFEFNENIVNSRKREDYIVFRVNKKLNKLLYLYIINNPYFECNNCIKSLYISYNTYLNPSYKLIKYINDITKNDEENLNKLQQFSINMNPLTNNDFIKNIKINFIDNHGYRNENISGKYCINYLNVFGINQHH